jgi:hypothetical protein
MKRQIAALLVTGVGLLGGCAGAVESGPGNDDESQHVEVEGKQQALWTEDCNEEQQGMINAAIFEAHFMLQAALDSYETGSERANHFFGVGYDDRGVQYRFLEMWRVMTDQDVTVVCAPQSGPICTRPDGKEIWASVHPDDIESHISKISVCDNFFNHVPEEEEVFWASRPGLLLHEMAHLAGALSDQWMGYDAVRDLAQWSPPSTHDNADSFRYYIYNKIYN